MPAAVVLAPSAIDPTSEQLVPAALADVQTPPEEQANTWSAAFGLVGALGFALALFAHGATAGQWTFAVALIVLFLSSTAYHGLTSARAKEIAAPLPWSG